MNIVFFILILVSVLFAAVTGVRALGAWLRYRHVRAEFQGHLTSEVDDLARRTTEIEASLAALDARAQQLPVKVSELQRSLTTLTVLTNALSTTLRQAQQVMSYSALKTFSSTRLAGLIGGLQRAARGR
jgi:chromosome segregation ATPase